MSRLSCLLPATVHSTLRLQHSTPAWDKTSEFKFSRWNAIKIEQTVRKKATNSIRPSFSPPTQHVLSEPDALLWRKSPGPAGNWWWWWRSASPVRTGSRKLDSALEAVPGPELRSANRWGARKLDRVPAWRDTSGGGASNGGGRRRGAVSRPSGKRVAWIGFDDLSLFCFVYSSLMDRLRLWKLCSREKTPEEIEIEMLRKEKKEILKALKS